MRVISGEKKGEKLFSLKRREIRPTSDKVKGAIFNILSYGLGFGQSLEGKRVLDLFAGSGALGLEALSRGAEEVVFVDNSSVSLNLARNNLKKLGFETKGRMVKKEILRFLRSENEITSGGFDLILADPPYRKGLCQKFLEILAEKNFLNTEGVLVMEHHKKEKIEEKKNFVLLQERKYGDTLISFFKKKHINDKKELL
ncbi:MAG: 16S rRNA (guanine(966)-N(2))-methyltransferase RsmD [candidate division Zixibacteria bacterium]|nr:16S rRNA (guanine(966)-N(2))-methyltransferase RsmD [candidate division Zixibacteria bacterium]